VWSLRDRSFGWKSESWIEERRNLEKHQENLLMCSTTMPIGDKRHGCIGDKRYLLVCSFSWFHGGEEDNDNSDPSGQFYVISCPPHVRPLRFANIVKTGEQLHWMLDHKQVLPLQP